MSFSDIHLSPWIRTHLEQPVHTVPHIIFPIWGSAFDFHIVAPYGRTQISSRPAAGLHWAAVELYDQFPYTMTDAYPTHGVLGNLLFITGISFTLKR